MYFRQTVDVRDWTEVAEIIRARRVELGLTQEAAAAASNGRVSSASWRVIESGRQTSFRHLTLAGVAVALGWPTDAIDRIVAGADPATIADPEPDPAPPGGSVAHLEGDGWALDLAAHDGRGFTPEERAQIQGYIDGLRRRNR